MPYGVSSHLTGRLERVDEFGRERIPGVLNEVADRRCDPGVRVPRASWRRQGVRLSEDCRLVAVIRPSFCFGILFRMGDAAQGTSLLISVPATGVAPVCPESVLLVLARSFEGFGESVVELLELDGGEVVDRAVGALGVEPLDPAGGGDLDLVDVAPGACGVDELGLVEAAL